MDSPNPTTDADINWAALRQRLISTWHEAKDTLAGLLVYATKRLAFGVVVLLCIMFLSFMGVEMAAGADLSTALGDAGPSMLVYLQNLLRGDLGLTTTGSETLLPRTVLEVIGERLPRSLGLLGSSLLFASVVGIFLGIRAARSRSQSSLGILITTLVGISIPSFFAAFLLQWLTIKLTQTVGQTVLPVGGFGWDNHLILPMLVLAARPVAQISRMTFVSIRQVLGEDYVRTARGKGLSNPRVMRAHVMRNAAIPILTTIGMSLRFILSSLPVVELYFSWPGVGVTLLKSVAQQDVYLVVGLTLCLGLVFILLNLLLDLSYRAIDPRLRAELDHIAARDRQTFINVIKGAWSDLVEILKDNPLTRFWRMRRGQYEGHKPIYDLAKSGHIAKVNQSYDDDRMRGAWLAVGRNVPLILGGLMVSVLLLIIVIGPLLAPNNPFNTQGFIMVDGKITVPPYPPGDTFPWGTDALGRGLLSLILSGAQQTLTLAILAVAARMLLGAVLGAIAGWANGSRLDRAIMGLAEIIAAFPTLLMAMILILAFGIRKGLASFILALCLIGWGEIMQFVRGEVMSIRPKPFVESAVAVGVRRIGIVVRHVMPNLFSALVSIAALEMGAVLMLLGELGFISIFIGGGTLIALPSVTILYSDVPEWGALLSNIRYLVRSYPWVGFYPMLAFFTSILSFNLFGEGIRRLVEEGNPLLNRLINRNTVLLSVAVVMGYNFVNANSGAMPFFRQQANAFSGERAMATITDLVDPVMEGRSLGSEGLVLAADYIAGKFEQFGLQYGGEQHTYFQTRKRSYERLLEQPWLEIEGLQGDTLAYGFDFAAYPGLNMTHGAADSPVRFMALGEPVNPISGGWHLHYPKLDKANFKGEVLLTLSPRDATYLSRLPKDGMLVVTDNPEDLSRRYTLSARSGTFRSWITGEIEGEESPYLWISEQTADSILAKSGTTVAELRNEIPSIPREDVYDFSIDTRVAMSVTGVIEDRYLVRNVIGLWPGSVSFDNCYDCPANKLIVVMAQYDSPPVGPEGVFPAANDNASGVAVLLEVLRTLNETEYQPFKSMLFVAYGREGLDGGERIDEEDVSKIIQANPAFGNFTVDSIVFLKGLGSSNGKRLEVSAQGSLRFAELFDDAARLMGVRTIRSSDPIDISLIYGDGLLQGGQEAPIIRLYWEGWEENSHLKTDDLAYISVDNLDDAGRVISMALMMMGRDNN